MFSKPSHSKKEIQKINIAIVSIPTAGHIKILIRLAEEVLKNNKFVQFTFILTSWDGFELNKSDKKKLVELTNNQFFIFSSSKTVQCTDLFGRAEQITEKVIEKCRNHQHILYDFMAVEGAIAAYHLNIPSICTIPAYLGVFNPNLPNFQLKIKQAEQVIRRIESCYNISLFNQIQFISGTLSIQASRNIVFSWKNLIDPVSTTEFRKQYQYFFMRPTMLKDQLDKTSFFYLEEAKKKGNKIIYFSLGTIAPMVMGNSASDNLTQFIKKLYQNLLSIAAKRDDLLFIFATGRNPKDLFDIQEIPKNVYVHENTPQIQLLPHIDLFINHCGANGVNEAIDYEVPMIGIPLMFDQHECAERIQKVGIGICFQHNLEQRKQAIDREANIYFRSGLDEKKLEDAINTVLFSPHFKQAIQRLKSDSNSTFSFKQFFQILRPQTEKKIQFNSAEEEGNEDENCEKSFVI